MSAIPNVPEDIIRSQPSNIAANTTHHNKARESAVRAEHVEDVSKLALDGHTNGSYTTNDHLNGVKSEIPWLLHDTPIENQRPIRVIVIGAGYSGVYCGIRIPERLRNCECESDWTSAALGS